MQTSTVNTKAIDFKGEAMTFKATTSGVLATLEHCLEMVRQSEDVWRKRLEREVERRRRLEENIRTLRTHGSRPIVHAGPDCEVTMLFEKFKVGILLLVSTHELSQFI